MRNTPGARFGLVLAGLLLGAAFAAPALAQSPPPMFQSWIDALRTQGYAITQGDAYEFTPSYCQHVVQPVFYTCFSSDPNDPYIVPELPVGTTYLDPQYGVPTAASPGGVLSDQFFRLNTTDAMLVIVTLPPQGAYFSYQTYMFSRPITAYARTGFNRVTPDPLRAEIFGSFNNSIDNVSILKQSGLNFGQGTVAFITTPNSALAASMSSSFTSVGGSASLLFTEAMGNTVKPGPYKSNDDFINVMRYSVPADPVAGDLWRTSTAANIQVYRVTQPAGLPVTRYAATPLLAKSYNADERAHTATLTELSQLLTTWLAQQEPGTSVSAIQTASSEQVSRAGVPTTGEVGPYCIANGTICASDSQDTDDYKTWQIPSFASNRIIIAAGVDHAATNNATFYSASVEDLDTGTGTLTASQTNAAAAGFLSGSLSGSAASVLNDLGLTALASAKLQHDLPNLYVHLFSRPCDPLAVYCAKPYTTVVSETDLPTTDVMELLERAYLRPGGANGANPNAVLNPFFIY